jgi:hypothetical protein
MERSSIESVAQASGGGTQKDGGASLGRGTRRAELDAHRAPPRHKLLGWTNLRHGGDYTIKLTPNTTFSHLPGVEDET